MAERPNYFISVSSAPDPDAQDAKIPEEDLPR